MWFIHKNVNHSVILSILLIACNQVDTKTIYDEDFIGSPKVTLDIPEDLQCQDGLVVVGYDVNDIGEIVNIHVSRSEPAGMFDQYVLDAFSKLKHHILRAKPIGLKGVTHKFTISARDTCKNEWR